MTTASRREFLQLAAAAVGGMGLAHLLPTAIDKAFAIAPTPGTTFWDAEHVVILMQENRSFDHAFGTLQGVRGFDDPRAIQLPNGNPVWVQTNARGESYAPFRLDLAGSKSTWMGCLPHGWRDQVEARNEGRYDRWIDAKRSGVAEYADMPLTMGYYNREDLPFYYALADAFTICDQNFCSTLTGTTPNRLHLWSGKIRHEQVAGSPAKVLNSEADHDTQVAWRTFPELLEAEGISWKVYQNELYLDVGLGGEAGPWLDNFGDNPLEYFKQFHVRFAEGYRRHLGATADRLHRERETREQELAGGGVTPERQAALAEELKQLARQLKQAERMRDRYSAERFAQLSPREQSLHHKAFVTNSGDPHYHELETFTYDRDGREQTLKIPKGDIFHQFRRDVDEGKLPRVSWIVAPGRFSDHPCSPWYGAWYLSECFNILTKNPEVWRKTIFLLTYDENDGFFDHVPPFVPPNPRQPETGKVSAGIDPAVEYVMWEEDLRDRPSTRPQESPLGLGYRVPLVIASPWSRGGCVCSGVFDLTSPIRFVETWLTRKLGREIKETNISEWRRVVCGDLTSAFQGEGDFADAKLAAATREKVVEGIHQSRLQPVPSGFKPLTAEEVAEIRDNPLASPQRPRQEPGTRPSSPLPYELAVEGRLEEEGKHFVLRLEAGRDRFGDRAAGAPFMVYYRDREGEVRVRNYAVAPGDTLEDTWLVADFPRGVYDLEAFGPNGFYRHFRGTRDGAEIEVSLDTSGKGFERGQTKGVRVVLVNRSRSPRRVQVRDVSYGQDVQELVIPPHETTFCVVPTAASHGWYDVALEVPGNAAYLCQWAGRVEWGEWSRTDPLIGS